MKAVFQLAGIVVGAMGMIVVCAAKARSETERAPLVEQVGPRGPVGPDVPLSADEKKHFSERIVVQDRTVEAVKEACTRAVRESARVVFLRAGEYVFAKTVTVQGGLTLIGEGSKTLARTKHARVCLFRVGGDNVRFTRLKLQGADTTPSARNNTFGIAVARKQNVRVDNCELLGFSYATYFANEATAQVDHCYIHYNLRNGLGYGVAIYSGAYVFINGQLVRGTESGAHRAGSAHRPVQRFPDADREDEGRRHQRSAVHRAAVWRAIVGSEAKRRQALPHTAGRNLHILVPDERRVRTPEGLGRCVG